MNATPRPGPRRLTYVLFALLSIWAFGGPLMLFVVGAGGRQRTWPPDRPVEWTVFWTVMVGFIVLMAATIASARRR